MRIAVFTGDTEIEATPWWPIICAMPGVERVLVCVKLTSYQPADVLRRQWRNVERHGWIWVPYRLALLAWTVPSRLFSRSRVEPASRCAVAIERLAARDIHSPELLAWISAWKPDLGVSVGAPKLRPSLFRIPRVGTINLHLGKVPDFRGAPPAFWELVTGATEIGATIHWVDEQLDTGAVIASARAPIYQKDTLAEVESRAEELGMRMMRRALEQVARGDLSGLPQPPGGVTRRQPVVRQRLRLAWRLAVRRWAKRSSLGVVREAATSLTRLALLRPLRDAGRRLRRAHPVRVFAFHRVTDLCRDRMTVSRALFHKQVSYIARHHDVVSVESALEMLRGGARLKRPVAVLTFDGGYKSVFDFARPVLDALSISGGCFVNPELVGTNGRLAHDETNPVREHLELMSWQDLRELCRGKWSVGVQYASPLAASGAAEVRRELERSMAAIREHVGAQSVWMACPLVADRNESDGRDLVQAAGYDGRFSDFPGENLPAPDHFDCHRIALGGDLPAGVWKSRVHGFVDPPSARRSAAARSER